MKFREKRQEEVSIDLTPFIDVVFMLLLFFVVTTALFKGATQLGIQLPKANAQTLSKDKNTIEIGIDAAGAYYLNGKAIGSEEPRNLKASLLSVLGKDNSVSVVVVGDKQSPHQAVVSALEVAGELGITKVRIIAQQYTQNSLPVPSRS